MMAKLADDERAALDETQAVLPDGWLVTFVIRTGRTWTASASPFNRACEHCTRVTRSHDRPTVQGQGDSVVEALAELAERITVTLDTRLMVRRSA